MTEIFSTNPIQAFSGQLLAAAFLIGLGLLVGIPGILQRGASTLKRGALGCASIVVILAGLILLAVTFYMYTTGSETLNARLALKRVIEANNPNDNGTITTYRLEFGAATQFDVPKAAYDKMTQGTCYQVVYYPQKGLLQMLGQMPPAPIQSGAVFSIKEPSPTQCR